MKKLLLGVAMVTLILVGCRKPTDPEPNGYVMPPQASFEEGIMAYLTPSSGVNYATNNEIVLSVQSYTTKQVTFTVLLKDKTNDVGSLTLTGQEATIMGKLVDYAPSLLKDVANDLNFAGTLKANVVIGTVLYQMPPQIDVEAAINKAIGDFVFHYVFQDNSDDVPIKDVFTWTLVFTPNYSRTMTGFTSQFSGIPGVNDNSTSPTVNERAELKQLAINAAKAALAPDLYGNTFDNNLDWTFGF